MIFYSLRLSDEEVRRLYCQYRSETYFVARHKHEFWYTRGYHRRLGGEMEMGPRRRALHAAISRHRSINSVDTVLDYGGDGGQLLSDGPGNRRAVFDLSGAPPLPGIERVTSEDALANRQFDLVVLANVLEHVAAPTAQLAKLRGLLAPGGVIFVAVPDERFPLGDLPSGRWYRRYLDVIRRLTPLHIMLDFYATAVRVKMRRIPPLGFAKMHEHVNLFSPRALVTCLELAGFRVLECGGVGEIVAIGEVPTGITDISHTGHTAASPASQETTVQTTGQVRSAHVESVRVGLLPTAQSI